MWKCLKCGEKSEHIFICCWNCNTPRCVPTLTSSVPKQNDTDFEPTKPEFTTLHLSKQPINTVKSGAGPAYRLARILALLGTALKLTGGGIALLWIVIVGCCHETSTKEVISIALCTVFGCVIFFLGVRVSAQSFIIKMTLHLLMHVAPTLSDECVETARKYGPPPRGEST
jgi:hypothetical protein